MNRPWMPLYIADYLRDTSHLGARESGAYLHLIMSYWVKGALPDDDRQLAAIARMTMSEWRRARPILAAFFGPHWASHKRIDAELHKASAVSGKRRASAHQRWSKQDTDAHAHPSQHANAHADASPDAHADGSTLHMSHVTCAEADASGAAAPIYADSRHELWGEGVSILVALGLAQRAARAQIGRWLRDTQDDAQKVLGAIQRARDHRVIEPIAWITRALTSQGKPHVAENRSLVAAARRAAERVAGDDGMGDPQGEPVVRLVQKI